MSEYEVKKIFYFHRPGPHNTDNVIHAVKERVAEGDIRYIVVASITGQTALKVAEKLGIRHLCSLCFRFSGLGHLPWYKIPFRERRGKGKA